jgi:hypothetical protein
MRNSKLKVKPYGSLVASPTSGYDASVGATISKGPLSVSVTESKGSDYEAEMNVDVNMSFPITKRVKSKYKL